MPRPSRCGHPGGLCLADPGAHHAGNGFGFAIVEVEPGAEAQPVAAPLPPPSRGQPRVAGCTSDRGGLGPRCARGWGGGRRLDWVHGCGAGAGPAAAACRWGNLPEGGPRRRSSGGQGRGSSPGAGQRGRAAATAAHSGTSSAHGGGLRPTATSFLAAHHSKHGRHLQTFAQQQSSCGHSNVGIAGRERTSADRTLGGK